MNIKEDLMLFLLIVIMPKVLVIHVRHSGFRVFFLLFDFYDAVEHRRTHSPTVPLCEGQPIRRRAT